MILSLRCSIAVVTVALFVLGSLAQPDVSGLSIAMRDIPTLTFTRGQLTAARRVSAVQQMQCDGGPLCARYADRIDAAQCTNQGWDGAAVNWRCEAEMSTAIHFSSIDIECEGFSGPGDHTVLVGSCALRYGLAAVDRPNTPADDALFATIAIVVCVLFFALLMTVALLASANDAKSATGGGDVETAPGGVAATPHCHRRHRSADCNRIGFADGVIVATLLSGNRGSSGSSSSWGSSSSGNSSWGGGSHTSVGFGKSSAR